MSSKFDVWTSRRNDTHRNFDNILDAVTFAETGPYLVTERVPLGDNRIMLVEELADGKCEDLNLSDLEQLEQDGQLLDYIRTMAMNAVREAHTFDFKRGRTRSIGAF